MSHVLLDPNRRSGASLRRRLLLALLAVVVIGGAFEGYRAFVFYKDASSARDSLLAIQSDVDLTNLSDGSGKVSASEPRLRSALAHTKSARATLSNDPLVWLAGHTPLLSRQVHGLQIVMTEVQGLEETGIMATNISRDFNNRPDDPNLSSIQEAVAFVQQQEGPMQQVDARLADLQRQRAEVPGGLVGPLASVDQKVNAAIDKLNDAVIGYARADALLPRLLGYDGAKHYLLLPQNDTELFPSGGLISSYGIVTYDHGAMKDLSLEYFGDLYARWQAKTHEYIEPPAPLKTLLQGYSWSLGEAGWYPDFNKTADLARSFVQKGGAPATDGTIAVDLQFMQALVNLLGPVNVPEYNVTVTADNISELTLDNTRDENGSPGVHHKAFLGSLAQSVMGEVFAAPKDQWVNLLDLLDQESRERHLQLNFSDPQLEGLTSEYGLDGGLENPKGDYLLVADASIGSTKLNLILQKAIGVNVQLRDDGSASEDVRYSLQNPFPDWKKGRDPNLVAQLMLDGVYGSYTRVYTPLQSELRNVQVDGKPVGAEQANAEVGKKAFGRSFWVQPGASSNLDVSYDTPKVVDAQGSLRTYDLYVQKEAGTAAIPLTIDLQLTAGAHLQDVKLDGAHYAGGLQVKTDLKTDRTIEVTYRVK